MPARDASRRCRGCSRIRSSGANGWPWTIPIAASWPARSGSSASGGSSWTIVLTSSKKLKSLAWMPLNDDAGEVHELRLRRRVGRRERVDARGQQALDAAEGADHEPVRVGRRLGDEVAVGDLAVVAGRQEQVLAALALVGAGEAHVGDVALPQVVDEATTSSAAPRSRSARRRRGRGSSCRTSSRCWPSAQLRRVGPRIGAARACSTRRPRRCAARCASRASTRPACSSRTRRSHAADRARRSCGRPCPAAAARRRTRSPERRLDTIRTTDRRQLLGRHLHAPTRRPFDHAQPPFARSATGVLHGLARPLHGNPKRRTSGSFSPTVVSPVGKSYGPRPARGRHMGREGLPPNADGTRRRCAATSDKRFAPPPRRSRPPSRIAGSDK